MFSKYIEVDGPVLPIAEGTFFGGEVEPGTFHVPNIFDDGGWLPDEDEVNKPLARPTTPPLPPVEE